MKIKIHFLALMLLFSGFAMTAQAAEKNMTRQQMETRVMEIKQRVNEIKAMDLSHLSREQRISLRSELKSDKKEIRQMDPTVIYIGGGALLIIIIILILVL